MECNERVKSLRKALRLTTTQFGDALGLTNSSISAIELGRRNLTEKHIKLICAAYPQVNENWLRDGLGDMFIPVSAQEDEIDELCEKFGLGGMVASMLRSYMSLDLQHKQMIHDWLIAWYDDFRRKGYNGGDGQTAGQLPDHLDNGEVDHQIAQSERLHDLLDKSTRSGA